MENCLFSYGLLLIRYSQSEKLFRWNVFGPWTGISFRNKAILLILGKNVNVQRPIKQRIRKIIRTLNIPKLFMFISAIQNIRLYFDILLQYTYIYFILCSTSITKIKRVHHGCHAMPCNENERNRMSYVFTFLYVNV